MSSERVFNLCAVSWSATWMKNKPSFVTSVNNALKNDASGGKVASLIAGWKTKDSCWLRHGFSILSLGCNDVCWMMATLFHDALSLKSLWLLCPEFGWLHCASLVLTSEAGPTLRFGGNEPWKFKGDFLVSFKAAFGSFVPPSNCCWGPVNDDPLFPVNWCLVPSLRTNASARPRKRKNEATLTFATSSRSLFGILLPS